MKPRGSSSSLGRITATIAALCVLVVSRPVASVVQQPNAPAPDPIATALYAMYNVNFAVAQDTLDVQLPLARALLDELRQEFPANPIFSQELARIDRRIAPTKQRRRAGARPNRGG